MILQLNFIIILKNVLVFLKVKILYKYNIYIIERIKCN